MPPDWGALVGKIAQAMREYGDERAREARAAAIEEAAQIAERLKRKTETEHVHFSWPWIFSTAATIEQEIRALADTPPQSEPVPDPEWIPWHGGPRPIAPEALVEVRLRNGEVLSSSLSTASMWPWQHRGRPDDVMAFRIRPSELP